MEHTKLPGLLQPLKVPTEASTMINMDFVEGLPNAYLENMSSARYPETDGRTKRLSQCLENYLRCFVHACPHKWLPWLPLAEFGTTHLTIQHSAHPHLWCCMADSLDNLASLH